MKSINYMETVFGLSKIWVCSCEKPENIDDDYDSDPR